MSFLHDCRYGARLLIRRPGFTAAAVATLALGIGANTAMFSVVNHVLLRPLPYPQPDRLVWISEVIQGSSTDEVTLTADFLDWRKQNHVFSAISAFNLVQRNLTGGNEPERVRTARVSADFLPMLGGKVEGKVGTGHPFTCLSFGVHSKVYLHRYRDREQVRASIAHFIDQVYTRSACTPPWATYLRRSSKRKSRAGRPLRGSLLYEFSEA